MRKILGLLGWAGIALVVAALAIRFLKPEWQDWSRYLALAGLAATALYAASQWRDIGRSFQGRNVKYGSLAAGTILTVLAILVGINYISNRQNKRWDLSAAGQFSLSDQTKQILTTLKQPLQIRVYYEPGQDLRYRDRLNEFTYLSKQVQVEYIDAVKDIQRAKNEDVQAYGTVVFEYAGRKEKATSSEEQDLANAMKKVIEGKAKKIYFVQGHGEHDTAGTERDSYSGFAKELQGDNFEVAKVTLAQEGKVPDDANVLVIAGPKRDFIGAETDMVSAYLKRGGKLLLFIDPPEKLDAPQPTSLIGLAKEWSITIGNDLIVDTSGIGRLFGAGVSVPVAMAASTHPIVNNFKYMTAYPLARSVTPIEGGASGRFPQKLLETSRQSWAETDLKGLFTTGKPTPDLDKGDKQGPIPVAAAVSASATDAPAGPDGAKAETRLVVVGDSDFLSNAALGIEGNRDLGVNMANWAALQENLISIRPKDPQDRRITMTQDENVRINWLAFVIIPGLLLLNGVRVWWRRR